MLSEMFDRFNSAEALIVEAGEYDDYENSCGLEVIGSADGDLQPYSGELAQRDYGLELECQYQFFCRDSDALKEGAYLFIGDSKYKIVYKAVWDYGAEVLLKEVKLYGERE